MYPTSGATLRADLNIKVEEAAAADELFIGHIAMPAMGMEAKAGTYPKLKLAEAELLSLGSTLRERGASYGEVSRQWGSDTYDCIDRGLQEPVDDTDAKDVGRFFNVEAAAARLTMRNVRLDHESRVATALMNTTNFGAGTAPVAAYTAANLATIDFPQDVLAAIERCLDKGLLANTIILSSQVYSRAKLTTKLQAYVRGTLKGNSEMPANATNIAAAFADDGIKYCLIGRARYNSAKKGAAYTATTAWGNTYIWVGYTNPMAKTPMDGGAGFTFVWNAEGGLFVTETFRDENRRSNMVRVRQNTTEKVTDGTAGTLITTTYS